MITNHLMLKLKNGDKDGINKTRDVLLSMRGKIENIVDLKVLENIRPGASNYDLLLIVQYDTMEDFEAYLKHPVHLEVAKYIGSVLETQAAVCSLS